jgi:hypothetical protein
MACNGVIFIPNFAKISWQLKEILTHRKPDVYISLLSSLAKLKVAPVKLVPTLADIGCRVVSATDPHVL